MAEGEVWGEMSTTDLLVWGIIIHLGVDWFLQNDWMAANKASLKHPASWVHSATHAIAMLLIFPPLAALLVGLLHILIDTRRPLAWWRRFYRQTQEGPAVIHMAFWQDQVAHILVIALVALILAAQ